MFNLLTNMYFPMVKETKVAFSIFNIGTILIPDTWSVEGLYTENLRRKIKEK